MKNIHNTGDFQKNREQLMTKNYTFNDKVIGCVIDSPNTTIHNNVVCLTSSEESELKSFLQEWIDQERSEIERDPEGSCEKAAKALAKQNSNIFKKLQVGGIGATTSLMGDLATGEQLNIAFVKAFFAFVGGVATA